MKSFQLLCFALASTSLAHADVRVVRGPGSQFNEIQAAVNAAVDGDLLLIRAGSYAPVVINGKALSLCADGAVNVTITGGLRIQNTAPTQVSVVSGVRVVDIQGAALELFEALGPVRIQNCVFTGANGSFEVWYPDGRPGAWVEGSTAVTFAACSFRGGDGMWCDENVSNVGDAGDAVFARGSRIAFTTCTLQGGTGGSCWENGNAWGGRGGNGLQANGGVYFAAGSTLLGGPGGRGSDAFGFDMGGCGGAGGSGAALQSSNTVGYWLDNTMSGAPGGPAGNAPGCPPQGPSGIPILTNSGAISIPLSGLARKFHVQQPIREQSVATLEFRGQPGDKVYLVEGNETRMFFLSLASHGLSLVRTPVLSSSIPLGVIPPNGLLQIQRPQGDLVPGLQHRQRFAQAILVDAAGQSFLTDVQAMELLDSTY